ncbi:MAG: hypothetical protein ACRDP3_05790 [Streptomyces sp.]|uniref:hypothetical protein n=1 Tax=Streptomyces sp. TaxID=1931 RepID=UPI003D6A7E0B
MEWDAVRLPAYLGDRVLAVLGDQGGAVIRDPCAHRLYWLVRSGSAASWKFPGNAHVQVLGPASWVTVPPRDRVRSAGPHWVMPIDESRLLTNPCRLRTALTSVIAHVLGPCEVAAR